MAELLLYSSDNKRCRTMSAHLISVDCRRQLLLNAIPLSYQGQTPVEFLTSTTPTSASTAIIGRQIHPLLDGKDADPATVMVVNPKFGLVAVGTSR